MSPTHDGVVRGRPRPATGDRSASWAVHSLTRDAITGDVFQASPDELPVIGIYSL